MNNGHDHIPFPLRLLRRFCPAHLYEEIEGDLIQQFYRDEKRAGSRVAQRKLLWNVVRFFRPGIILRNKLSIQLNTIDTLRSNMVLAKRSIVRNRTFSLIHISGLSAAMVVCLLIFQYVRFELSYDDFHQDAENIFRVSTKVSMQNELINHGTNTYEGIIDALKNNFPEAVSTTSFGLYMSDKTFIRYEDENKKLRPLQSFKALNVDSLFLQVFSFLLVEGNAASVLRDPYSALVSETISHQYFSGNALGKILEVNDGDGVKKFKITGVLKDIPENSHVKFDLVVRDVESTRNFWNGDLSFWDWGGQTYIKVAHQNNTTELEKKLNALAISNNGLKRNKNDYEQVSTFELQPLTDIHLHSRLSNELEMNGSAVLVFALIVLAGIIILVAWVNYINLSTAISEDKRRSIGIRKVIGASRARLISQVLTESALYNIAAAVIAVILVPLVLPYFSEFAGIPTQSRMLFSTRVLVGLIIFILLTVFVAGAYPAFVITSSNPIRSIVKSAGNVTFRKVLVVLQFFAATVLIIATVASHQQLSFMKSKELGINIEQVIVIRAMNFDKEKWSNAQGGFLVDPAYQQQADLFKNALRTSTTFVNATSLSHLPGQLPNWGSEFKAHSIDPEKAYRLVAVGIDYDFLSTFQVRLLAGRNFSREFSTDRGNEGRRAILINESASKLLGFKSPTDAIHHHLSTYWGADYEIIGVVNSFHQLSLKENLQPIYFILQPRALDFFAVHYRGENVEAVVAELERSWTQYFPDSPFDYFFLDQYFNRQYLHDQKFGDILGMFSLLAVFMACLGLFGFTSYAVVLRTKEVGIRKVLGATMADVIGLFTKDFVRLILLSNLIALPVVYFGVEKWFENYAFKITLGWWFFALPVVAVLAIAMITICLQTAKVALRNPVDSLKHE